MPLENVQTGLQGMVPFENISSSFSVESSDRGLGFDILKPVFAEDCLRLIEHELQQGAIQRPLLSKRLPYVSIVAGMVHKISRVVTRVLACFWD